MSNWQILQHDIGEWAAKTFPHQTVHSKITHLRSELDELDGDPTDDLEEFADCFMLLMDAARLAGYSMHTILLAVETKLVINKERSWAPPDEDGVSFHVKETV